MEALDAIEGVIPGRDEGEIPGGDAVMEHESPELTKMNSVGFYMNRFQELVGDVPNDFEAWTSLIAHVEKAHPNDIERICLIYDAFLSEYPLCYGYWNKYANHKARLCTLHEVEETYERAVLAVPYSVDIWVKYCSFGALTYEDPMDIRSQQLSMPYSLIDTSLSSHKLCSFFCPWTCRPPLTWPLAHW